MKYNKIKPVIRLIGSKYRLFNQLYNYFDLSNINEFYDIFGGTGIVGINVKNINNDLKVYINDYDKIFPLTKEYVEDNNKRFNGYGAYSKASIKQYKTKIKNGLWDKLNTYNKILKKCIITHKDYKELLSNKNYNQNTFLYLDPPYFSNFKAYKHQINLEDFFNFIKEFSLKNKCKIAISFKNNNEFINYLPDWKIHYLKHTNTNVSIKEKDKNANEILITNY
ncbi:Site-specific DNA methylase [Mycoplasmopsis maculosa]|uniref:Site-specific DNA methylase n=1 Tax=Mycoplasmopsis maculosa TaxID=114885 RepID=A0A449B5F4_9BACT|nr:DNA adenine methylase [Mycoplasmopsis maculosa]VEU75758.1 Site-specific DNA methylase [Mycoplasmopsis maculosa]